MKHNVDFLYPHVLVDTKKIEENARHLVSVCEQAGISVMGVTKGVCGAPPVARAMLNGGVHSLGDSRLQNIERMKNAGINARFCLLRVPTPSEARFVPDLCDMSLQTEPAVARMVAARAREIGSVHQVILMVDVGERREGVMPERVVEVCREMASLEGIELVGLGTNVACYNGVLPTYENVRILVDLAREVRDRLGIELPVVSGGNTATTVLLEKGQMPRGVTQLRIGEGIILGTDISASRTIPGIHQDTIILRAQVAELQRKPSAPEGRRGLNAFGLCQVVEDRDVRLRGILAIGRQDVEPSGLKPLEKGVQIVGASSDHTIIDLEDYPGAIRVGDVLEFGINYPACLRLMTSPYVQKFYVSRA